MTRAEILQALDRALRDEAEAISEYHALADGFQEWVNTLPPEHRVRYQRLVNQVRFILGDEARHRSTLEDLIAALG